MRWVLESEQAPLIYFFRPKSISPASSEHPAAEKYKPDIKVQVKTMNFAWKYSEYRWSHFMIEITWNFTKITGTDLIY